MIKTFLEEKKLDLKASKYKKHLISTADLVIIALPTDVLDGQGQILNTNTIERTLKQIAGIDPTKPIVIKSTVPTGFTSKMISKYSLKECFFSPEFIREGKSLYDNFYPSRIILGSNSAFAREFAQIITGLTEKQKINIIYTDNNSAELIKLASNSYLAMRVAFSDVLIWHVLA